MKVCAQRQSAFTCYHNANSKDPHTASTHRTSWWIWTVFSLRYDNVHNISMKVKSLPPCDVSGGSSSASHCGGVKFVMEEGHCEKGFFEAFGLLLPVSFHQCYIRIFISMLPLPGRQTGEAWGPPKNQYFIGIRGALDIKVLPIYSLHFGY
jgi:hypothetical protein